MAVNFIILKLLVRLHLLPAGMSAIKKAFWMDWIQIIQRRVKARFKIYVTLYQILLVLPFVFDFKFPNMYTVSMSFFEILGASVKTDELSTTCMWKGIDYVDSLVVGTVYPIILTLLLLLSYWLHRSWKASVQSQARDCDLSKQSVTGHDENSGLKSRYFSAFLYLTYLTLPVSRWN
jgi:hypothetical protein